MAVPAVILATDSESNAAPAAATSGSPGADYASHQRPHQHRSQNRRDDRVNVRRPSCAARWVTVLREGELKVVWIGIGSRY